MRLLALIPLAALAACAGQPKTIVRDRIVEVKVPVPVPCLAELPDEVTALRETMSREEWDVLTTDQRENLLAAQALAHKAFGGRFADAAAGCRPAVSGD